MARLVQNANTVTAPVWAGDYFARDHMLPGGARLDAAAFPAATPLTVVSGTALGRTLAERAADAGFGPAAAGDDEVFLVCFDVFDANRNPDVELYRPGSIVKENFLPGWDDLAAEVKTLVRAAYLCTVGAA